jgi:hypothetical protein
MKCKEDRDRSAPAFVEPKEIKLSLNFFILA